MARHNLTASAALTRLREGNQRYTQNVRSVDSLLSHSRRDLTVQAPFAIILGCSDARAPAEIVFDQGLGDLFVIRVAGNIVAPSQIGSVEFAAERFGTRLVVIMGHTGCGAIGATLEAMERGDPASRNLLSIVSRIRPGLEGVPRELAVRANVMASVKSLRAGSPILEELAGDGLTVVGAELDLVTGVVEFFEDDYFGANANV
jgi:carbonic anhydrase